MFGTANEMKFRLQKVVALSVKQVQTHIDQKTEPKSKGNNMPKHKEKEKRMTVFYITGEEEKHKELK